jgi:hypothetical protein
MPKMEMARFYNAGDPIKSRFNYTKADEDMRVSNCVGYFDMNAPRQGFFEVPREMKTQGGSQFVGLPKEVIDLYGSRGIVMIDLNLTDDEAASEVYVANSEESAQIKGRKLWLDHCLKVTRTWEETNEQRATMGLQRTRPTDFTVHAYKELGMLPPLVANLPTPTPIAQPSEDVSVLKKLAEDQGRQLKEQGELLQQLLANQTAPAEAKPTSKGKSA